MTKIPLDIDTTPLARAIERSKRKTMTKHTMTKHTMTNIMTYIAEVLAVALMLLLGVAILSL
jgi:hypothetical protein